MKLTYVGKTYECESVEKTPCGIVMHTGKYEDDEEIIYRIYGDIDYSKVILEGGTWTEPEPTAEERLRADLDYLAIMTGVAL